jgi:hypothetical protein
VAAAPGRTPGLGHLRLGVLLQQSVNFAGNVDDAKCGTIAFCKPSHGARLLNLSAQPLTTSFASTPDFSPRHLMHGNHRAAVADC